MGLVLALYIVSCIKQLHLVTIAERIQSDSRGCMREAPIHKELHKISIHLFIQSACKSLTQSVRKSESVRHRDKMVTLLILVLARSIQ